MTPSGVGKRGGGGGGPLLVGYGGGVLGGGGGGGRRVLLMMAYTGRLFQASGNSDIKVLLVEVYEKVGIPVIAVCERTQKG